MSSTRASRTREHACRWAAPRLKLGVLARACGTSKSVPKAPNLHHTLRKLWENGFHLCGLLPKPLESPPDRNKNSQTQTEGILQRPDRSSSKVPRPFKNGKAGTAATAQGALRRQVTARRDGGRGMLKWTKDSREN